MTARCLAVLAAGCFALSAGCLTPGTVTPTRNYLLDPAIDVEQAPATDDTLGVRPVEAARPYNLPMAYLKSGGALLYYQDASWAEQPSQMVSRALKVALAKTKRFADVGDAMDLNRPDYVLTGELRKFHEDRTTEPAHAEIELHVDVRGALEKRLLWTGTLHERIPLPQSGAEGLATAMKEAVGRVAEQIAEEVIRAHRAAAPS